MALPRILHHNIIAQAASVVASSTATGMAVANLSDGRPYTWWGPSAAPASIEIDAGVATEADYLYIPSHTLDSTLWDVSLYAADLPFSGMQLLPAPEDFSNAAWTKMEVTVTANAVAAPDGTTTADKVVETAVNGQHLWSQTRSVTNGVTYTYSFFAKLGEKTTVSVHFPNAYFGSGSPAAAVFNLSTGVVTSVGGTGATASISALEANGYYRCTVTQAASASGGATFYSAFGSLSVYTGDGTSGLYLWGAMLNAGSTAAPYIPVTAGRWISETALCYSNRVPKPRDLSTWTLTFVTTVANAAPAPNGSNEATEVTDTTAVAIGNMLLPWYELHASEGYQTGVMFIRKTVTDAHYCCLSLLRDTGGTLTQENIVINTNTGVVSSVLGTPLDYGVEDAGDYWLAWLQTSTSSGAANSRLRLVFYPAWNNSGTSTLDVAVTGSKIIWGAKLEKTLSRPAPFREDAPLYLPFTSTRKRYWLLRLNRKSGSALCAMSVCMIGKALTMPTGLPQGYDPVGRKVVGQRNRNEHGQPLGTAVDYKWRRQTLRFQAVSWAWVRNVFARLWDNGLASDPAGFIWDYESHVEDVQHVTLGEEFRTPHKSGQLCDLEFDVEGVVE